MKNRKPYFSLSPYGLAALGLMLAPAYFLLVEHRAHVWYYLPYVIFLVCPALHLFMHGRHRENKAEEEEEETAEERGKKTIVE